MSITIAAISTKGHKPEQLSLFTPEPKRSQPYSRVDYSDKPIPSDRLQQAAKTRGYRISYSFTQLGYWLLEDGKGKGTFHPCLELLQQVVYAIPKPKEHVSAPFGQAPTQWRDMKPIPLPWEIKIDTPEKLEFYFSQISDEEKADVCARIHLSDPAPAGKGLLGFPVDVDRGAYLSFWLDFQKNYKKTQKRNCK